MGVGCSVVLDSQVSVCVELENGQVWNLLRVCTDKRRCYRVFAAEADAELACLKNCRCTCLDECERFLDRKLFEREWFECGNSTFEAQLAVEFIIVKFHVVACAKNFAWPIFGAFAIACRSFQWNWLDGDCGGVGTLVWWYA